MTTRDTLLPCLSTSTLENFTKLWQGRNWKYFWTTENWENERNLHQTCMDTGHWTIIELSWILGNWTIELLNIELLWILDTGTLNYQGTLNYHGYWEIKLVWYWNIELLWILGNWTILGHEVICWNALITNVKSQVNLVISSGLSDV